MGRTSKFTFPVPGRKQKKPIPSPPADISVPLTKAQKILGTGGLNVDAPIPAKDHSRFWETRSNSAISISISESTTGYTNDTGLGRLDEGEVVHGVSGRHARWDDESAIIPRARNGGGARGNAGLGGAGNDALTDASSLRRQRSSSTINTYYDKSKVPLSISQQTASSAMAKGLPKKASALLDMDGSYDSTPKARKKKPSRLDLSYLLPKSKSPKHLTPPDAGHRNLVLGPDMMTRSPSIMSVSPAISPPPIEQQSERKPRKKLTLETLRNHRPDTVESPKTSPAPNMRTASSVNELHNLYEHYEQRSFDEMMGTERSMTSGGGSSPRAQSSHASSPGLKGFLSPYSNSVSRTGLSSRDRPQSRISGVETPTISLMTPSSLKSPPTDTASISSRHTRTSKASKRTDRSMTDIDLRQNSVLSLSSDSEDDYEDRPNTSLSAPRRPSDTLPSPTSPNLNSFPQPPSPQAIDHTSNKPRSAHSGPVSPTSRTQFDAHNSPAPTQVTPPKIAERTSSLSASSNGTQKASASRFSLASTATARSVSAGTVLDSSARRDDDSDDGQDEFRPIAFIPFRHHNGRNSQRQSPHRQRINTRLSTASDQSTGPLSPTSIDFYLQSQHNSMAFDASSIRSGKSMRSSIASTVAGGDPDGSGGGGANGRFIAVTRQEEMLLAALRNKRARMMRDEIIAEFEEDDKDHEHEHDGGDVAADGSLRHPQQLSQQRYDHHHQLQTLTAQAFPGATASATRRASSDSKRSSGRHVSRNSSMSTVRLASLPEQPYGEQQQQQLQPPPPSTSTPLSRKTSRDLLKSSPPSSGERIPLYLGHPHVKPDNTSSLDGNSDIDDFSDFDYLGVGDLTSTPSQTAPAPSSSSTGSLSGSFTSPSNSASTSISNPHSHSSKSRTTSTTLNEADLFPAVPTPMARREKSLLKSRFNNSRSRLNKTPGAEDVPRPVRHLEQAAALVVAEGGGVVENDVPRPDSPISPVGMEMGTQAQAQLPKKKQARLSAVGFRGMEAGLWGDDG